MKKEKSRNPGRAGRFLAAALALGILATAVPAPVQAEDKGSLTVQLEAFSPPSVMEGVGITLSRVGDADVYDEPEFYEKYDIAGYPVNSKETEEAIDKLLAAGALADAAFYEVTDAGGAARFAGLPDGIYLGAAQEASHYGEIAPFLFHTPYYYETENEQPSGPLYEVNIYPKALPLKEPTITPEPIITPVPTEAPGETITPTPTEVPEPTITPAATPTPEPIITPVPTEAPGETITPTPTEAPEPTITPAATPTPEPIVTPVPTEAPGETITPTPTEAPEATITPTAEPIPGEDIETPTPTPGEEGPTITPTPGADSETLGGAGHGTGGTGTDSPGKGSSPKTGDDTPTGTLLALLCVSGLTIEIIRSRRKKV